MLGVCSVMGLPWFVAATVLSISHVNSLKLESECSAPGEVPKFLGIREQRFTGLMIFTLMGCSVFMTSMLKVRVADRGFTPAVRYKSVFNTHSWLQLQTSSLAQRFIYLSHSGLKPCLPELY